MSDCAVGTASPKVVGAVVDVAVVAVDDVVVAACAVHMISLTGWSGCWTTAFDDDC